MHFTETGVVTLRKPSSNFDVWRSDPRWHASINPVNLVMQNDGNLRAFERNHRNNEIVPIFATNTNGKCPAGK